MSMSTALFFKRALALFILVTICAAPARATNMAFIGPMKVVALENGWYGEGLVVKTDFATTNTCAFSALPNEYGVPSNHPGYNQIAAEAAVAYTQHSSIYLWVDLDTCAIGRISVSSIRLT